MSRTVDKVDQIRVPVAAWAIRGWLGIFAVTLLAQLCFAPRRTLASLQATQAT